MHAEDPGNRSYGAPRVTAELNDGADRDQRVNHKRVARVMAVHGIAGIRLRRRARTTVPEPADQQVPDLLERNFTADQPNRVYVGDITYLPCADGTNLYLAYGDRLLLPPAGGLVDRRAPTHRTGHRRAGRGRRAARQPAAARRAVFAWNTRYNTRRRHSTCAHMSPLAYEASRAPATLPTAA